MDLVIILVSAKIGAFFAVMLSSTAPGLPLEIRVPCGIAGWFAGLLVGIYVVYVSHTPPAPTAKPVRSFPKQIAGSKCASCKQHIIMAHDGFYCTLCGKVYCTQCPAHEPCNSQPIVAEVAADRPFPLPQDK